MGRLRHTTRFFFPIIGVIVLGIALFSSVYFLNSPSTHFDNRGYAAPVTPQPSVSSPDLPVGDFRRASAPNPVNTGDYLVSAWYMTGWGWVNEPLDEFNWHRWLQLWNYQFTQYSTPEDVLNRYPRLTYYPNDIRYPEEKTWVLDYEIKWALEHGIGAFFFDWFWDSPDVSPSEGGEGKEWEYHQGVVNSGLKSFLNSEYNKQMLFALLWCNHPGPRFRLHWGMEEAEQLVHQWATNYFNKPNYMFIEGKPVIMIIDKTVLVEDLGSPEQAKAFLDRMEELSRRYGYEGIYFIMQGQRGPESQMIGFDASTNYSNSIGGINISDSNNEGAYDDMVSGLWTTLQSDTYPSSDKLWLLMQNSGPYIPIVTAGSDWGPKASTFKLTGASVESFRYLLIRARDFVDAYPSATFSVRDPADLTYSNKKIMTIYAWNEWTEGGFLFPSRGHGFKYLDAIRTVFTKNMDSHADRWMDDGLTRTTTTQAFSLPLLFHKTDVRSDISAGDGQAAWVDYQIRTSIIPVFPSGESVEFGIAVYKNGESYVAVSVRSDGIYARVHTPQGFVGSEYALYYFETPLISTAPHTLTIDVWKGRLNVMWDGKFGKTLYMQKEGEPFASVTRNGGISTYTTSERTSVTYDYLTVHSLLGLPQVTEQVADVNGDGAVNLGDLIIVLAHFGTQSQTLNNGDINDDGIVNISDLTLLLAVFGR